MVSDKKENNKCRLCLGTKDLIWIFGNVMVENIQEIIRMTSGVDIKETDNITQMVCGTCCQITIKMYKFRMTSMKNNEFLKVMKAMEKTFEEVHTSDESDMNDDSSASKDSIKVPFIKKSSPKVLTVHTSIKQIITKYPELKLPQNLPLGAHFGPYITLLTNEVNEWYKERDFTDTDIEEFKQMATKNLNCLEHSMTSEDEIITFKKFQRRKRIRRIDSDSSTTSSILDQTTNKKRKFDSNTSSQSISDDSNSIHNEIMSVGTGSSRAVSECSKETSGNESTVIPTKNIPLTCSENILKFQVDCENEQSIATPQKTLPIIPEFGNNSVNNSSSCTNHISDKLNQDTSNNENCKNESSCKPNVPSGNSTLRSLLLTPYEKTSGSKTEFTVQSLSKDNTKPSQIINNHQESVEETPKAQQVKESETELFTTLPFVRKSVPSEKPTSIPTTSLKLPTPSPLENNDIIALADSESDTASSVLDRNSNDAPVSTNLVISEVEKNNFAFSLQLVPASEEIISNVPDLSLVSVASKCHTLYTCKICDSQHATPKDLRLHIRRRHTRCAICGGRFRTLANLEVHRLNCRLNTSPIKVKDLKLELIRVDEISEMREKYVEVFKLLNEVTEEEDKTPEIIIAMEEETHNEPTKDVDDNPNKSGEQSTHDIIKELEKAVQDAIKETEKYTKAEETVQNKTKTTPTNSNVKCVSNKEPTKESTEASAKNIKRNYKIFKNDIFKNSDIQVDETEIFKNILLKEANKYKKTTGAILEEIVNKHTIVPGGNPKVKVFKGLRKELERYKIPIDISYNSCSVNVQYTLKKPSKSIKANDSWQHMKAKQIPNYVAPKSNPNVQVTNPSPNVTPISTKPDKISGIFQSTPFVVPLQPKLKTPVSSKVTTSPNNATVDKTPMRLAQTPFVTPPPPPSTAQLNLTSGTLSFAPTATSVNNNRSLYQTKSFVVPQSKPTVQKNPTSINSNVVAATSNKNDNLCPTFQTKSFVVQHPPQTAPQLNLSTSNLTFAPNVSSINNIANINSLFQTNSFIITSQPSSTSPPLNSVSTSSNFTNITTSRSDLSSLVQTSSFVSRPTHTFQTPVQKNVINVTQHSPVNNVQTFSTIATHPFGSGYSTNVVNVNQTPQYNHLYTNVATAALNKLVYTNVNYSSPNATFSTSQPIVLNNKLNATKKYILLPSSMMSEMKQNLVIPSTQSALPVIQSMTTPQNVQMRTTKRTDCQSVSNRASQQQGSIIRVKRLSELS